MKYSYNWLKDYVSGVMPEPRKLADLLTSRSFEVDSVEKQGNDWVLDIKVLSNRAADCLSHMGIAREIAVILQRQIKLPSLAAVPKDKNKKNKSLKVKIENFKDCPRYSGFIIRGVKVGASPRWLKSRLEACGLQSISNIVDITNYVMLETGQPLHAFDLDKLGANIIVRRARKEEFIKTLDKEKTNIILDENVLVIADDKKPVAIAGIKGGLETGIDENTKNIIIEAANFSPVIIRRASQKLKIRTDASWRFENGLDLRLTDFSLARVARLIKEIAQGEVESYIDVSVALPKAKQIRLDFKYLEGLLGVKISPLAGVKILKSLGCRLLKSSQQSVLVEAPSRRLDLKTPEDLIEEIGRFWGCEKLPETFPEVTLGAPQINKSWTVENKAKDILVNLGFSEAYNHTFIGENDKEIFSYRDDGLLEIANPTSELNKFLRPSLAPYLLKNVRENFKNFNEINVFEIGKVFTGQKEWLRLAVVMAANKRADNLFCQLKGRLEVLLNDLGIKNISFNELSVDSPFAFNNWQKNKTAAILNGQNIIGVLGEVDSLLLEKLTIKGTVWLCEINFQAILELSTPNKVFQPISPYPASLRDIAILMPEAVKAAEAMEVIKLAGGKLLVEVELFDIYSGPGLPQGKKNLAFHLVYQSGEKTLSAEEINVIHQKIFEAVGKAGWEVRK